MPAEQSTPARAHAAVAGPAATLTTHGLFGFLVQWQLPEVTHGRMTGLTW